MKTSVINTRISNVMKEELELLGKTNGEAASKIVRDAIEAYLKGTTNLFPEDECEIQAPIEIGGFSELIYWICENRYYQHDKLDITCFQFLI